MDSAINLSPAVKAMISDYMREREPHSYGNESHALSDFRNWCVDAYEMPSLICLREDSKYTVKDREKAIKHMNDYFKDEPRYYSNEFTDYSFVNCNTRTTSPGIQLRYRCEKYFHDHIGDLAGQACISKYGNVKNAILNTSNWIELWNEFEDWFQEKRERFMQNMDTQITEIMREKEVQLGEKRKPAPLGAIANLCKVLTKTMEKQGADITSIAKVQYAICVQNGVYIPNEFLTDVAVALDAEGKLNDQQ